MPRPTAIADPAGAEDPANGPLRLRSARYEIGEEDLFGSVAIIFLPFFETDPATVAGHDKRKSQGSRRDGVHPMIRQPGKGRHRPHPRIDPDRSEPPPINRRGE